MPQFNPLVLQDQAGVDHTFTPRDITGGVATYVESAGIPLGDNRLSISQTRTSAGRVKPVLRFVLPVVQDAVINGVSRPTVVRTAYVDVTMSFDAGSTAAERLKALVLAQDALSETSVRSAMADLQGIY